MSLNVYFEKKFITRIKRTEKQNYHNKLWNTSHLGQRNNRKNRKKTFLRFKNAHFLPEGTASFQAYEYFSPSNLPSAKVREMTLGEIFPGSKN